MLTQTLRAMERDGLVVRTVHPVVPPKVEYCLSDLGHSLGEAFCGVWIWAETNLDRIEKARPAFDSRGYALAFAPEFTRRAAGQAGAPRVDARRGADVESRRAVGR